MSKSQSPSHREIELLEALRRLGGSARSAELAKVLDVSEETVRRTLKALAKGGSVERVHGGAYLTNGQAERSFFSRIGQDTAAKEQIAEGVAVRVQDGMTLFLDAGSTTAFIAEALRQRSGLTVATNSIGAAQALANHNGNRVHLLGGELHGDDRSTFGFVAEQQARRFVYDIAVLSADALPARHGVLYNSAAEAQLALVVADAAEQVLVAVAHTKFDGSAPHRGPETRQVDVVVTDQRPGKKMARVLADLGVLVEMAGDADKETVD